MSKDHGTYRWKAAGSKLKKAQALDVPCISLDDLDDLLEGHQRQK